MSSDFGSRTGPPLGPEEIALHGGSMTAVWRVGETVRRATGRWTPAVHALLDHLERAGFEGAPRALGIDTAGREILTFLSGASDWPKNDGAVLAVGRLLRRYHDAVATFVPPPGMPWRIDRPLGLDELVCHNDLQPANTVFRDGEPVAFIDWDLAGPAPAIFDLARAAWDFIPLRSDRFCLHMGFKTPPPRARRLRLLCDGTVSTTVRKSPPPCTSFNTRTSTGSSGSSGLESLRSPTSSTAERTSTSRQTSTGWPRTA